MSTRSAVADSIRRMGLLTIEDHDEAISTLIANGSAKEEPRAVEGKLSLTGIACPVCGFRMMDVPGEEKVDPAGLKFRKCGCFRCGAAVWRRTP